MSEQTTAQTGGQLPWRRLSGAGDHTPPDLELLSRSEGDLRRNAFRPSQYPRLAQNAVCNDDGTPIGATTDALLAQLIEQQGQMLVLIGELQAQIVGLRADLRDL